MASETMGQVVQYDILQGERGLTGKLIDVGMKREQCFLDVEIPILPLLAVVRRSPFKTLNRFTIQLFDIRSVPETRRL